MRCLKYTTQRHVVVVVVVVVKVDSKQILVHSNYQHVNYEFLM